MQCWNRPPRTSTTSPISSATAVEEGGRELGRVTAVAPYEANDVLELDSGLSFPMVGDCILEVDLEQSRVVIARGFADPG